MFAISTSWNVKLDTDLREWMKTITSLGFKAIELSYTLTNAQLTEIESLLKEFSVRVTSIHNFCPLPFDEPSPRHPSNHYRLSSLEDYERAKAVDWTQVTIDTAKRVGAGVVVIHAGTVEMDEEMAKKMFGLYSAGKNDTAEFTKARDELLKIRKEKKAPYLEALKKSLADVMDYAQDNGIKIGLETRYYPIEIPNFEEVGYFLDLFGKKGMYYWHDVGHAEVNERLKIKEHLDFLKTYKDKMIGVHLHGMRLLRDHLAPFDGDMDLTKVLPYFPGDMIKVIEARHATFEQVKSGIEKLGICP